MPDKKRRSHKRRLKKKEADHGRVLLGLSTKETHPEGKRGGIIISGEGNI